MAAFASEDVDSDVLPLYFRIVLTEHNLHATLALSTGSSFSFKKPKWFHTLDFAFLFGTISKDSSQAMLNGCLSQIQLYRVNYLPSSCYSSELYHKFILDRPHPANCKLPIFMVPPLTSWVGNTGTLFKGTAPHSSLVVSPKTVHEEAICTRRKLS